MGNLRGTHSPRLGLLIVVGLIASLGGVVDGNAVDAGGDIELDLPIPHVVQVVTPVTTPPSRTTTVNGTVCKEEDVRCGDGQCVPSLKKCDGIPDCLLDNNDEVTSVCGCPKDMHVCGGFYPMCVPLTKLCDGKADCARETDEDPDNCHKNPAWIKSRQDPDVIFESDTDWRCNCLNTTECRTHCVCAPGYFGPFCQHLKALNTVPNEAFLEISFNPDVYGQRIKLPRDPSAPLYTLNNKCLDPLWKLEVMFPTVIYLRLSRPINFDWLDVVWRSDRVKQIQDKISLWLEKKPLGKVTEDFVNVRGKGPKYVYRMTHVKHTTFLYDEVRVNVTPMEVCDIQLSLGRNVAYRAVPRIYNLIPGNEMPWYRLLDGTRFSKESILVTQRHPDGYAEASVYFPFQAVINVIILYTKRVEGCGGSEYFVAAWKYRETMVFGRNFSHYSLTGPKKIFAPSKESIHRVTVHIFKCMNLFEVEVYGVKRETITFEPVVSEVKDSKKSIGSATLVVLVTGVAGLACIAVFVTVKLIQRKRQKAAEKRNEGTNRAPNADNMPERDVQSPDAEVETSE